MSHQPPCSQIRYGMDARGFGNVITLGTINYFDGWAFNPDTSDPIVEIRFSVGREEIGFIPIGKERPDLERSLGVRVVGFSGVIDLPAKLPGASLDVDAVSSQGRTFRLESISLENAKSVPAEDVEFSRVHNLPSDYLIHLVVHDVDRRRFYEQGRKGFQFIEDCLQSNGLPLSRLRRVLDFGVGCGRVFRWWEPYAQTTELFGTDLAPDLIAWCQQNLPFGRFQTNGLRPPLAFPGEYFDFIYLFSVFTHLAEPSQRAWLEEFHRILAPGGHLLVSTHGQHFAQLLPPSRLRRDYEKQGFVVMNRSSEGQNICATYQSRAYFAAMIHPLFEARQFIPEGLEACGKQDVHLLRKL